MSDDFTRGRWEGHIEASLETHDRRIVLLEGAIQQLQSSIDTFNSAHKQREAVTIALADLVKQNNARTARIFRLGNFLVGLGVFIIAIAAAFGAFH